MLSFNKEENVRINSGRQHERKGNPDPSEYNLSQSYTHIKENIIFFDKYIN